MCILRIARFRVPHPGLWTRIMQSVFGKSASSWWVVGLRLQRKASCSRARKVCVFATSTENVISCDYRPSAIVVGNVRTVRGGIPAHGRDHAMWRSRSWKLASVVSAAPRKMSMFRRWDDRTAIWLSHQSWRPRASVMPHTRQIVIDRDVHD